MKLTKEMRESLRYDNTTSGNKTLSQLLRDADRKKALPKIKQPEERYKSYRKAEPKPKNKKSGSYKIITMLKIGLSHNVIKDTLGISLSYVLSVKSLNLSDIKQYWNDNNIKPMLNQCDKLAIVRKENVKKVIEMLKNGATQKVVATKVGISVPTVSRIKVSYLNEIKRDEFKKGLL